MSERTPELVRALKAGSFPDSELEVYKQRAQMKADLARSRVVNYQDQLNAARLMVQGFVDGDKLAAQLLEEMNMVRGGGDGSPLGMVKQGEFDEDALTAAINRTIEYRAGETQAWEAAKLDVLRLAAEVANEKNNVRVFLDLVRKFELFKDDPMFPEEVKDPTQS